jgi:hypothetical protein
MRAIRTLHRWRRRVLDLDPTIKSATAVRALAVLRAARPWILMLGTSFCRALSHPIITDLMTGLYYHPVRIVAFSRGLVTRLNHRYRRRATVAICRI